MLEDVPGSFCGTSSSSSKSMGLCFFAFGKSRGFFASAVATLVPQLLTDHRYLSLHVQVLVLAIWIFVVFWSYQSLHQVL